MTRTLLVSAVLAATFVLPWYLPALAALALALWVPLLPLSVGILLDTLSYAPHASFLPWSAVGLVVSIGGYAVHRRLSARIIGA